MYRHLRYEANAQQVLREGAGVISPLGVGTLWGSDTRRHLRHEDNARHVSRWGAGVVDSLWRDSRRGAVSCLATVAPSPPPAARRVARQTRMLLFCHGGKTSLSSPPPGEPTTVVAVVPRGEEFHVVATVARHELETPKVEHRLGLKRLLKTPHLELNVKVIVNTQQPLPGAPTVGVLDPGDPQPDRPVNLSLCVPAQMGWREMEHKGGMYYPAPGVPLVVGVTSTSRGRESLFVCSSLCEPPLGRPWTSLL
jgi:hypothetical protein